MELFGMDRNFLCYAIVFAAAAIAGLLVFLLTWLPMRRMLGANDRLKQTRPFFVRTLFLVMLLSAIAPVVGRKVNLSEGSATMEYVWQAAGMLGTTCVVLAIYLFGFVVVMTILAASLGKYRDE